MTPEEINIAIAESLGVMKWSYALPKKVPHCDMLDYHSSLDACAEFEATITTPFEMSCYASLVFEQLSEVDQSGELDFCMITATAPQRCEAYLRLKRLWKEGAK